jgi:hypothetical protein
MLWEARNSRITRLGARCTHMGNCKMVDETMFFVVKQCIFNQTQGYLLIFYALNVALSVNVYMQN